MMNFYMFYMNIKCIHILMRNTFVVIINANKFFVHRQSIVAGSPPNTLQMVLGTQKCNPIDDPFIQTSICAVATLRQQINILFFLCFFFFFFISMKFCKRVWNFKNTWMCPKESLQPLDWKLSSNLIEHTSRKKASLFIKIFWTIVSYHPWTLAMFFKTFTFKIVFYPSSSWFPLEFVKVVESYVLKVTRG